MVSKNITSYNTVYNHVTLFITPKKCHKEDSDIVHSHASVRRPLRLREDLNLQYKYHVFIHLICKFIKHENFVTGES